MKIPSFNFFVFLCVSVILYYCFPKRCRWLLLLAFSLLFFLLASWKVSFYLLIGLLAAYFGARFLDDSAKTDRTRRLILVTAIGLLMAVLALLKYVNIVPNTVNAFGDLFGLKLGWKILDLVAPIGISYYTLTLWAYLTDVYRGTVRAERNPLKLALFTIYYPCLICGPLLRYRDMQTQLFAPRSIDWNDLFQGFHRIVYGLLKKLFVADTLAAYVQIIFSNTARYSGYLIPVGVLLYAIQIYCDFSGCMDIVIGASRLYGVRLPENFDAPFLSRTLSEFWRRWHMTLGLWGKDYILYPLLKSERFQRLGKSARKRFGKKLGKKLPMILAILILWVYIGIWHGATYRYIFAAGILPWIYLSLSELLADPIKRCTEKLRIPTDAPWFHLVQSFRTLLLMLIIWLIVLSPSLHDSVTVFGRIFTAPAPGVAQKLIRDVLRGSLTDAQVYTKYSLLAISLMGVFVVDRLKYRGVPVGERFNQRPVWFRYLLLFAMLFAVISFGVYGPGYNPVDFIYGGF